MKIYLKGFYGYKNFGDELLLLGFLNYLYKNYKFEELVIETPNTRRLSSRVGQNAHYLDCPPKTISYFQIPKNKIKFQFSLLFGKFRYKKYFKVFGGGEVLNSERKFPHNGRNFAILFNYSVRKKNFLLAGGIGKDNKFSIKILYKFILPNAKKIILREKYSYENIKKYTKNNVEIYHDFAIDILNFDDLAKSNKEKYILINVNSYIFGRNIIKEVIETVKKYDTKTYYFPCDMEDDINYFEDFKILNDNIKIYDWTKHPLSQTLKLFNNCLYAYGARLHFLLPLKIYNNKFKPIIYKDKIRKIILN